MSVFDGLEHVRVIGSGAFSIVREYRTHGSREVLAVKQLKDTHAANEEYIERFKREVALLAALAGTPHVVELIGQEIDGPPFRYAMPRARANLAGLLRARNSQLMLVDRLSLFEQILAGMKAAHAREILHRDLAPNNVLVFGSDDKPYLAISDFGLGKSLADTDSLTRSSVASLGQLYFVAPEQRNALKSSTVRSDVYSLGKILNFVLTGKEPDVIHACEFNTVCKKACAHDPEDRYTDLGEFEKEYTLCKNLLLRAPTPTDEWTLGERLASGEQMKTPELLRLFIKGDTNGEHIYYGLIQPTIGYLNNSDTLDRFVSELGQSESDFMGALQKHLQECYDSVGWPFSSMDWFGAFLLSLFQRLRTHEAQLTCLEELWLLAYVLDQWKVQNMIYDLINDGKIPDDLATDFAMVIAKSEVRAQKPDFRRRRIHPAIMNAIDSLDWDS